MKKAKVEKRVFTVLYSGVGQFVTEDVKRWLVGALITATATALTYLINNVGNLHLSADQAMLLTAALNLVVLFIKKMATSNAYVMERESK
jgi:hypothetical protein